MSVRPVNFLSNGDIQIVYDETGHSGTIPAAEIKWTTAIDGTRSQMVASSTPHQRHLGMCNFLLERALL